MLGCNESNIIFQQHLCKLGQPTDLIEEGVNHSTLEHGLGVLLTGDGGVGLQAVCESLSVSPSHGLLKLLLQSRLQPRSDGCNTLVRETQENAI